MYTGDTVYGDTDGTGGTGGTGETLRVPDAFGLLDRDQPPEDGRITVEDLVTSAGGEDTNGPQGKIDGNVDAYDQTLYHTGDLDHLDKLLDQTQGHADAVIFEQDGREVSVADAKALKVLLDKYVVEAVAEPHIAESDPQNPPLADPSHLTQAEGDFFLV